MSVQLQPTSIVLNAPLIPQNEKVDVLGFNQGGLGPLADNYKYEGDVKDRASLIKRNLPCFAISAVALTAIFGVSLNEYKNNPLYHNRLDWVPPLVLSTVSYMSMLAYNTVTVFRRDETVPINPESTNNKLARVGVSFLGGCAAFAGGVATASGLTYGGPLIIGLGTIGIINGVISPENVLKYFHKGNSCFFGVCSKVSSCFRWCLRSQSSCGFIQGK